MKHFLSLLVTLFLLCADKAYTVEDLPLIAGDTIDISVLNLFGESEFQFNGLKISKQHTVFIPRLGRVVVSGVTGKEFIERVRELAQRKLFLKTAEVEVVINKVMWVDLQVKQDYYGSFQAPYGSSIGEFLGMHREPGGIDREDFGSIKVIRNGSVYSLDLLDEPTARNFELRHGDRVSVDDFQANRSNSFYLVGNFSKPGRYALERTGFTVMDLLGEARGALTEPKYTRRLYVFRKIGDRRKVIEINMRDLTKMGDLSQDIEIQQNDVLLASVERKVHTINKLKDILERYIDIDSVFQQAELIRLFK